VTARSRTVGTGTSVLDAIGHTPLVAADRLLQRLGLEGRLLVKLEYLNPGLSKKDRVALEIVQEALADGDLAPGQPVVELTSGNTGTGLAIVCGVLGHPFVAVMSKGNTAERARMMRALGAEVVLVDQAPGARHGEVSGADVELVEAEAQRLVRERGAFRADQFERAGSVLAHERHTGPEIWEASGGTVRVFAGFIGSSGSFTGVMRGLRNACDEVRGYAIEPTGAAILAGHPVTRPGHRIQGGGYSRTGSALPLFDPSLATGYVTVTDTEAVETARLLARTEGIFGGFSTGASAAAAIQLLRGPEAGETIAVLASDSGLKYLSTELYA
jgi:cysteine synthase A